jgi:hypothetical protein
VIDETCEDVNLSPKYNDSYATSETHDEENIYYKAVQELNSNIEPYEQDKADIMDFKKSADDEESKYKELQEAGEPSPEVDIIIEDTENEETASESNIHPACSEENVGIPDIELTIEELLSEYALNYATANDKFINKIIKLTGFAAAIDIKEVLSVHYIRMTDSDMNVMQSVQCMFDKKYAEQLRKLEKGQPVIIQGRYTGSLIAMRMSDCILIQG